MNKFKGAPLVLCILGGGVAVLGIVLSLGGFSKLLQIGITMVSASYPLLPQLVEIVVLSLICAYFSANPYYQQYRHMVAVADNSDSSLLASSFVQHYESRGAG
jgi:branched-subunit amino acid permease